MPKLEFHTTEVVKRSAHTVTRYPNLSTVLMVEDFLKSHADLPLKLSDLHRQLPKKIMHQTLKIILEYLWRSGKIIYGPRGVQWIHAEPAHLQKMLAGALEL